MTPARSVVATPIEDGGISVNLSLLLLLAAIALFVCALLVAAGVIDGVSNAAFVDAGLGCLAASLLPFRR